MPIEDPRYHFTAVIAYGAPSNSGVYALWQDRELIYIGRAASIRQLLIDHLEKRDIREATHYSWELSLRPLEREAELLEQFRKRHGHLPRCNAEAA